MFQRKSKPQPTIQELEEKAQSELQPQMPHHHKDENGFLRECYHVCGNGLTSVAETLKSIPFWVGVTVSYPFEHFLWEHVPVFSHIAHWIGMH